jgi:hypothetical protein
MYYLIIFINEYINKNIDINYNETIPHYLNRISDYYDNISINVKNILLFISINFPLLYIDNIIYNNNISIGFLINDNSLIIIFNNNNSFYNCLYNLTFPTRHISINNVEVNKFFLQEIILIYDELIDNIQNILKKNPNYYIYISGHSTAGAEATIFTYILSQLFFKSTIKLITFGIPKIGNNEWYNDFNNIENIIHYRISNENDIITILPFYNYFHVGINIQLNDNNVYIINNNEFSICNNFMSLYKFININHHNIENYYLKLKNKNKIINNLEIEFNKQEYNLLKSKSISFSDEESFQKEISYNDFNRIITPDFNR